MASKITCKNIFKNGKPSSKILTEKWIELINQLEKAKQIVT